jgi:hypothetical protein
MQERRTEKAAPTSLYLSWLRPRSGQSWHHFHFVGHTLCMGVEQKSIPQIERTE